MLELPVVEHQLVEPEGRALADGGELRGLQMGVGERGHVLVAVREIRQQRNDVEELAADDPQALPHDDHVGVVADVAARRAQVDDPLRRGALHPVGVDVAHHIVTDLLLPRLGDVVVDVVRVGLQLGDLRVGDREALPLLRPGQGDPQLPPGFELVVGGKNVLHFIARVTGAKGAFVSVVGHLCPSSPVSDSVPAGMMQCD